MAVVTTNLGAVTAYADAVAGGYTGTKAEWQALMASYGSVAEQAAESASQAADSASAASEKASEATTAAETATTAKNDAVTAKTAAETAQGKAETAQGAAEDAAESVSASAAQIATNTSDITELKSDLTTIGAVDFVETDGFIGADGSIGSSPSDEAKYTNKINVKSGDVVSIHLTLPQDKSMWMAYATYNTSGAFVERVVFVSSVTGRAFDYSVTIGTNISAISFTYRTYGISTTTIQRYSPLADLYTSVPSASVSGIMQNVGEQYEAELGTIYLGIDEGSNTRCRTKGFIPMHGGVVIPSGYPFGIQYYDADKKYITSDPSWNQVEKKVGVEGTRYIRLVMRKPDNSVIATDDVETIAKSFTIIRELNGSCFNDPPELPSYFSDEVIDCRNKLESYCTEKALVFALVTDSHIYNYSDKNSKGWWKDTVRNIKSVNSVYQLDALVHMGDMVNGSLPKAETIDLIRETRDDLRSVLEPNFILVGNHDDNSFTSYPITEAEMYALFCRYNEKDVTARSTNKLYWYKDYEQFGIRVVFLSSHLGDGLDGQSGETWGYPQDEITWFTNDALNTDKQILMLSHMPFTQGYISGNANLPTNGNLMKQAVNSFIDNGGAVIGLINGHTHFDYVNNNGTFYEISQGAELNTKNTTDKTGTSIASFVPESAIQYGRTERTLTQDLWNILVVRPTSRTCKLIRFGAGDDVTWSY